MIESKGKAVALALMPLSITGGTQASEASANSVNRSLNNIVRADVSELDRRALNIHNGDISIKLNRKKHEITVSLGSIAVNNLDPNDKGIFKIQFTTSERNGLPVFSKPKSLILESSSSVNGTADHLNVDYVKHNDGNWTGGMSWEHDGLTFAYAGNRPFNIGRREVVNIPATPQSLNITEYWAKVLIENAAKGEPIGDVGIPRDPFSS